jgi:hypothetical protein
MKLPKKPVNALLFYIGVLGLLTQLLVSFYLLTQGRTMEWHWWFHGLAPGLCLSWGLIPTLQLQKED